MLLALALACSEPAAESETDDPAPATTVDDVASVTIEVPEFARTSSLTVTDADGDGPADLVVAGLVLGQTCVFHGPIAASPVWDDAPACLIGENAGVSSVLDVDADGNGATDLILASPDANGAQFGAGRVYLALGPVLDGRTPLRDAFAIFEGEGGLDGAGVAVAFADDDDGAWLVVGAPGSDTNGAGAGRVYVVPAPFSGGTYALGTAPTVFQGVGFVARHAGDEAGEAAGEELATSDLDGDGLADLVVGVGGNDDLAEDAGIAAVWFGPLPTGLVPTADAEARFVDDAAFAYFGEHLTDLGDLDGDGRDDLVVTGVPDLGQAWIYSDVPRGDVTPDAAKARIVEDTPFEGIGDAFAAFDQDGDGALDLAVGAPYADHGEEGRVGTVYLVHGPLQDGTIALADASERIRGAHDSDNFGEVLAAGDLDGDGRPDLVAAAPSQESEDTEHVYVLTTW